MILIYGSRHYGVVDRHAGEYAVTRVVHLYWLPLLPIGSMWVTSENGDQLHGHRIRFHGRSVAAAFLRPWGLGLGTIAAIAGIVGLTEGRVRSGAIDLVIATILLAAGIWSLRTRNLRGARARREHELACAAFGSGCDPRYLPRQAVDALLPEIQNAWARTSPSRTPSDVARLGPSSPQEGVLAWALLRLRARVAPSAQRRGILEDAARIAERLHETPAMGAPYRAMPSERLGA